MKQEQTVVLERVYDAPVSAVWHALTDREAMKQWYFDTIGFKPVVGAEFSFTAGSEDKKYLHLCQVKEMIPNKLISYSWRYDGEEGNSVVSFELFDEDGSTRLKLTHTGLETFTLFKREEFMEGWNYFVNIALVKFLSENKK